ncbi:MAG: HlyC/CorC family transporter [Proteobacteria bacterium]|nr:HlyC/CorC family transporter [Pseudomonadota bacterium]
MPDTGDRQNKPPQSKPATVHNISEKTAPPLSASKKQERSPQDDNQGVADWFFNLFGKKKKPDSSLRDALEEFIEEVTDNEEFPAIAAHERALITNAIRLRGMKVVDVMIPRADITAIEISTSQADLLALLSERQYSRFPVYRETLDDVVGTIHIKDILATLAKGEDINIDDLVHEAPIVSPSMPVFDLILMMKRMKKHMALVVDEYGGIDGLVTIGDVIEAIIGEIEDEHDSAEEPQMLRNSDGTVLADGRLDVEELEEKYGKILTEEEREDIDTLGGLVFELAGHIPARGEVLRHQSGMVLEVLDADPRRVNKILIRNLPSDGQ